ncbi:putative eukaryotic aspartyl protease [Lyophyllum shimeji]|uniref:Eukaryotic aspartyl protease n=1 Tax=Lyophyllum shimeji TaxID=47721 RepID=A0A9P3PNF6_LYOSH|nr:putative eukaryotic aspartyl protease [Lyophyllum shimeji]
MSRFVINAIPFETRVAHDARQILARDQARAKKLLAGLHPHGPAAFQSKRTEELGSEDSDTARKSIDVTDAGIAYTVPVKVGNPPTEFAVLLDIGSTNTWVGADKEYRQTGTSQNTGKTIDISYGSGSFTGTEFTDQVTLGGNLFVKNQTIGVASSARGFSGVDGILGIGPADLTTGPRAGPRTPSVTENLLVSGIVPTASFGMAYHPTSKNVANGEITFGAADTAKFTGSINYVPITTTAPADQYWGIDLDLAYGADDIELLKSAAGIVDSGTTLLLLASDAFESYRLLIGAEADAATGLLTVTEDQFADMESLFFMIGSETYELTPNAQIWPRGLNATIGGEEGKIYLIVADLGSPSGAGLDFINGFAFLQRFYTMYDTTNSRVGIAKTKFTNAEIN